LSYLPIKLRIVISLRCARFTELIDVARIT
jgi:hypothetical protein